jgi:HEAT repeat protein
MIAKHRPGLVSDSVRTALLRLLADPDVGVRSAAAVACGRAGIDAAVPAVVRLLPDRPEDLDRWTEDRDRLREKQSIIEARARCAFALGLLGAKRPEVIEVLVDAVKHRAMHRDLFLVGLDGAMAAQALGKLQAAESVDALREALFRDDPALEKMRVALGRPVDPASPSRWWDFNMHTFIPPALAEIGSDRALSVLETALAPSEKCLSPHTRGSAAAALLNARAADRVSICAKLLQHGTPEVRRPAILFCLKTPDFRYRKLLEPTAPWALPWWDAQHGGDFK